MIVVVLMMEDKKKLEKYTARVAAGLITLYITFESSYSGMSMNPARTFASAIVSNQWKTF